MRWIVAALVGVMVCGAAVASPCQRRLFENNTFTICGFDSRDMTMAIAVAGRDGHPYGSFAAYAAHNPSRKIRFAMNAGMFGTDGWPIGLYVANGIIQRKLNSRGGGGNFHMKPNGIFAQTADGALILQTTPAFQAASPAVRWATQSGPMLVIDGALHPQLSEDGPSRYRRNGVGLLDAHRAWFVISEGPVSFGRLARFFRDGLHCRNALYFDGAVSSLWIPRDRRQDAHAPLGPMVIVADRK
jgi:uncharacterized protein YigE (DUF2233 family)